VGFVDLALYFLPIPIQVLDDRTKLERDRIVAEISSGKENRKQSLLEQWLREGKLAEDVIINETKDIFAAAVDTVRNSH